MASTLYPTGDLKCLNVYIMMYPCVAHVVVHHVAYVVAGHVSHVAGHVTHVVAGHVIHSAGWA